VASRQKLARALLAEQPNQIQYTWGYIAAGQLTGFRPQADRYIYNIFGYLY
jgi:hypothetical protein